MKNKNKKIISVFLLFSILLSSWLFAKDTRSVEEIYTQDFQEPIITLLYWINGAYYDKDDVDYKKVLDETLNGLVKGIDDPFAWYFNDIQTEENKIDDKGEYGGLGITVRYDQKSKSIVVVSPMADTPAFEAGIQPNDYIISVDGSSVSTVGYYESVQRMRGEPGTIVTLEVIRKGWLDSKKIKIIRKLIETKSVKYDVLETDSKKIAYLKLLKFGENSAIEMKEALTELSKQTYDGFILDLRNNGGGYLNVAIDIASMLIKNGEITTVNYFDGRKEVFTPMPGKYFSFLKNLPFVTLVNGGSASASEILTGALKDNNVATILGTKTFGKAAVQRPIQLSNGGEVWLPIGHYFTPSGKDINLKGIEPNILIENPIKEIKDITDLTKITSKDQAEALNSTTKTVDLDLKNDTQLHEAILIISSENKN